MIPSLITRRAPAGPGLRGRLALLLALLLPAGLGAQESESPSDTLVFAIDTVRVEIARLRSGGVPLSRLPYSAQVVRIADLPRPGALSVADALSGVVGVSTASQFGNPLQPDLRLRGFQAGPVVGYPQSVSVFVDGVRVNEPDASQVNFDLIPLHAVERIEVVRSPGGAFGRNTLAGAIHVVTRRADRGEASAGAVELAGGSFGTARTQGWAAGSLGHGFDYLASGRYHRTDGWRDLSATRLRQAFLKAGYRAGPTDLSLAYTFADNYIEAPGSLPSTWLDGRLPPELTATVDARRLQFTGFEGDWFTPRLHFLSLDAAHDVGADARLHANAYLRSNHFTQFNDNITEPNARGVTEIGSAGATLQLAGAATGALSWAFGAEAVRNRTDILIFEEANPAFPDAGGMTESVASDEDSFGAFGQAWWEVSAGASLFASARYDHVFLPVTDRLDPENSGENTFGQVTGSLGGEVALLPGLHGYASYGRGFRAPVILEISCADPEDPCPLPFELGADPPLDPVVADTWQAGVRYARPGFASIEGTVFTTDVRDDLFAVVLPPSTRGYFENLDRTRRRGAELTLRFAPLPGLDLRASAAWTRATFESHALLASALLDDDDDDAGEAADPGDGEDGEDAGELQGPVEVRPGDRFAMVPALTGGAAIEYRARAWRAEVEASYVGSQYFVGDEANTEAFGKLGGHYLVGTTVQRSFGRLTLFGTAENLLGTVHETFGIISPNVRGPEHAPQPFLSPGLPRRFEAGVRYLF